MELKPNQEVTTPHGDGTIVKSEGIDRDRRYAVELVLNPFWFSPVYYWPHEIKAKYE